MKGNSHDVSNIKKNNQSKKTPQSSRQKNELFEKFSSTRCFLQIENIICIIRRHLLLQNFYKLKHRPMTALRFFSPLPTPRRATRQFHRTVSRVCAICVPLYLPLGAIGFDEGARVYFWRFASSSAELGTLTPCFSRNNSIQGGFVRGAGLFGRIGGAGGNRGHGRGGRFGDGCGRRRCSGGRDLGRGGFGFG